jgi:UTP--glucose-1-phosphate uridylyltransferase
MLDVNERTGKSVVALKEVAKNEISSYGCAAISESDGNVVKIAGIVEKPKAEDAPSNLAVMGRYVLTPDIFDILEQTQPGAGGEIQLTDALAELIVTSELYGYTFDWGRFDIGKKIDFLRATVELALERDDLGPEFRKFLQEVVDRDGKPGS